MRLRNHCRKCRPATSVPHGASPYGGWRFTVSAEEVRGCPEPREGGALPDCCTARRHLWNHDCFRLAELLQACTLFPPCIAWTWRSCCSFVPVLVQAQKGRSE